MTSSFSGDRDSAPQLEFVAISSGDVLTLCTDGVIIDEATQAQTIFRDGLSQSYEDGVLEESVLFHDSDDATILCYQHGYHH